MGYDLHITRAEDWSESEQHPISRDEWVAYVRSDPEMRLDGVAETATPDGGTLRYANPGLAVWLSWSGHGRSDGMAWFDHRNGEIKVKNPDRDMCIKMHQIATALGARVQGDDGEFYDSSGEGAYE
jgi:hypothetical protein